MSRMRTTTQGVACIHWRQARSQPMYQIGCAQPTRSLVKRTFGLTVSNYLIRARLLFSCQKKGHLFHCTRFLGIFLYVANMFFLWVEVVIVVISCSNPTSSFDWTTVIGSCLTECCNEWNIYIFMNIYYNFPYFSKSLLQSYIDAHCWLTTRNAQGCHTRRLFVW